MYRVGHQVKVNKSLGYNNYIRLLGPWNHNEMYDWNEVDFYYKSGVDYIMKEDGLYTLNGIRADKEDNWHPEDDNGDNPAIDSNQQNYRYDQRNKTDSLKDSGEKQLQKIQNTNDSLRAAKEKQIKKMQDSLQDVKDKLDQKAEKAEERTGTQAEAYNHPEERRLQFHNAYIRPKFDVNKRRTLPVV